MSILCSSNTRQALITPIQQNLSGAFPYDESTASASYTCDPSFPKQNVDEQYVSCGRDRSSQSRWPNNSVECAAGTEWNETAGECEDCPPDTYRKPPMASCVQCPDNKITGGLNRAPSVRFCYSKPDFNLKKDRIFQRTALSGTTTMLRWGTARPLHSGTTRRQPGGRNTSAVLFTQARAEL